MIYDIQKASFLKRISAFLLDLILVAIIAVGVALLLSWATGYDKHSENLQAYYDKYEKQYNVKFSITAEEYEAFTEAEKAKYDEAYKALINDSGAMAEYQLVASLVFMITSISILVAILLVEFVVPLILKNGQTLGKKVFNIGVVFGNGVRVTPFAMFVRAILGKYTIETMVPVLIVVCIMFNIMGIVGLIVLAALALLQIVLVIATKTNSFIHDLLANTVVVDMATQMIFDNYDSLVDYKAEVSRQQSEQQNY